MPEGYSIYLADRLCGGGDHPREWYHACLFYVSRSDGRVVQQLHFSNTKDSLRMQPYVEQGLRIPYSPKMFGLRDLLRGDEAYVLSAWNHMLKYAVFTYQQGVTYDEDFYDNPTKETLNCRAGVNGALDSIMKRLQPGESRSDDGIACTRMPPGVLFLMAAKPFETLEELREENEALINVLQRGAIQQAADYDIGPEWATSIP